MDINEIKLESNFISEKDERVLRVILGIRWLPENFKHFVSRKYLAFRRLFVSKASQRAVETVNKIDLMDQTLDYMLRGIVEWNEEVYLKNKSELEEMLKGYEELVAGCNQNEASNIALSLSKTVEDYRTKDMTYENPEPNELFAELISRYEKLKGAVAGKK